MKRFSKIYLTYITSAHWRYVKRPQVFERYGYRCMNPNCPHEDAGSSDNPYQVNHLQYPKRGSSIKAFMNQPVEQFNILCKKCHDKYTRQTRKKYEYSDHR